MMVRVSAQWEVEGVAEKMDGDGIVFVLLVVTMGATRDTSNHSLFKCFCTILDCFNAVSICFGWPFSPWLPSFHFCLHLMIHAIREGPGRSSVMHICSAECTSVNRTAKKGQSTVVLLFGIWGTKLRDKGSEGCAELCKISRVLRETSGTCCVWESSVAWYEGIVAEVLTKCRLQVHSRHPICHF